VSRPPCPCPPEAHRLGCIYAQPGPLDPERLKQAVVEHGAAVVRAVVEGRDPGTVVTQVDLRAPEYREGAPCPVCGHRAHGDDPCGAIVPGANEYEVGTCECEGRSAAQVYAEEAARWRARADTLSVEVAALRALKVLAEAPPSAELAVVGDAGRAAFEAHHLAASGTSAEAWRWEQLPAEARTWWTASAVGALSALLPNDPARGWEQRTAADGLVTAAEELRKAHETLHEREETIARLTRELEQERAVLPATKLGRERTKREHFRCEMAALRRWYAEQGHVDARGMPMLSAPSALDLFEMYPDLRPADAPQAPEALGGK
jgi:hypothetical protein